MIEVVKSNERGLTNIDWLESYHSFSFGEFYDESKIHFGPLRVLNDDTIQPGMGFPKHPHSDMEIVTIVTQGELAHEDSEGNRGVIGTNEIQRMTAGHGIFHSEFNNSQTEVLKLYQIWILPNQKGLQPEYQQIAYSHEDGKNKLNMVVSGTQADNVIFINQDVDIYLSDLELQKEIKFNIRDGRGIYIHVVDGELQVGSNLLSPGDAAMVSKESEIIIKSNSASRFILFDVTLNF